MSGASSVPSFRLMDRRRRQCALGFGCGRLRRRGQTGASACAGLLEDRDAPTDISSRQGGSSGEKGQTQCCQVRPALSVGRSRWPSAISTCPCLPISSMSFLSCGFVVRTRLVFSHHRSISQIPCYARASHAGHGHTGLLTLCCFGQTAKRSPCSTWVMIPRMARFLPISPKRTPSGLTTYESPSLRFVFAMASRSLYLSVVRICPPAA